MRNGQVELCVLGHLRFLCAGWLRAKQHLTCGLVVCVFGGSVKGAGLMGWRRGSSRRQSCAFFHSSLDWKPGNGSDDMIGRKDRDPGVSSTHRASYPGLSFAAAVQDLRAPWPSHDPED